MFAGKDTYARHKMQGCARLLCWEREQVAREVYPAHPPILSILIPIDFPTPLSYLHLMSQTAYKTGGIAIAEAYAHCKALTCAHYENFPVGSVLIPKSSAAPCV